MNLDQMSCLQKKETFGFFFQGETRETRTSVGDNYDMSSSGEQSM